MIVLIGVKYAFINIPNWSKLAAAFEVAVLSYFDFRVGDNLNIKVADFGLARDLYIKEYYRQQSIGKIPVKWMAPEALHDKISNEKTDVVS